MLFSSYVNKKKQAVHKGRKQADGFMFEKICSLNIGQEETIYKVKVRYHLLFLIL